MTANHVKSDLDEGTTKKIQALNDNGVDFSHTNAAE